MNRVSLLVSILLASLFFSCQSHKGKDKEVVKVTYVHRYGVPMSEHDWQSLGQTGEVEKVLKSGIKITSSFHEGLRDGKTSFTYPHSDVVHKEEMYSQGKLLTSQKNYPNGSPQEKVEFLKEGKKIQVWYEGGAPKSIEVFKQQLLSEGQYFNPKHEMDARVHNFQGTRMNRDGFGKTLSTDTIENGKLALQSTFFSNQEPKAITPYKDGLIHGERKTFLSGGVPHTIEQWEKGKQHGITVSFLNGEKNASVVYVNGKKHGVELRFAQNGEKLVEEIHWSTGLKHGPMRSFLSDNQTQVEHYFRGRLVSKVMFDDLEQKIR